ncbi:MAG: hypothetical protein J6Z36_04005 [Clostridia bacterium]|nr:hypothetical protein [Clostridia bacterium]
MDFFAFLAYSIGAKRKSKRREISREENQNENQIQTDEQADSKRKIKWLVITLCWELLCVPMFIFGGGITFSVWGIGLFLGPALMLLGLVAPFIGIVSGIVYLASKNKRKIGVTLAVIVVLLPIVVTVTTILLLSAGVIRITLM